MVLKRRGATSVTNCASCISLLHPSVSCTSAKFAAIRRRHCSFNSSILCPTRVASVSQSAAFSTVTISATFLAQRLTKEDTSYLTAACSRLPAASGSSQRPSPSTASVYKNSVSLLNVFMSTSSISTMPLCDSFICVLSMRSNTGDLAARTTEWACSVSSPVFRTMSLLLPDVYILFMSLARLASMRSSCEGDLCSDVLLTTS
mmetsp:Transcript_68974/g.165528  ORF Transcript_68974/g.165528 Transcript_68974/m.165528 type:complete len:203 (+) Transcript_68974:107-715(+)